MARQKCYTVYKFDELTPKAQVKALDKLRETATDGYPWYDPTIDDWKTKLEERGFTSPEIYFSGFWSQGDGACFEARIDLMDYLKDSRKGFNHIRRLVNADYPISFTIEKNSYGHLYSHSKTRYIDDTSDIDTAKYPLICKAIGEIKQKLAYEYRTLSDNIYSNLEESYNYLISDEAIKESIEANNYEFNEDGGLE